MPRLRRALDRAERDRVAVCHGGDTATSLTGENVWFMKHITEATDVDVQRVRAFMAVSRVDLTDLLLLDALDTLIARRELPNELAHLRRDQLFDRVKTRIESELELSLAIGARLDDLDDQLTQTLLQLLRPFQP